MTAGSLRARVLFWGGLSCGIVLFGAASQDMVAEGPLLLPDDTPPPAFHSLGPIEGSLALALTNDGSLAAAAFRDTERSKFSLIRLASAEDTREVEVRGIIQALRFSNQGDLLLAIAHRLGKKRVLEAYLLTIDPMTLEERRSVNLPDTARALDLWTAGSSILVACENQVRTVSLPQMRSGRLFWIEGKNRAVASLPGGDLMLLGQEGRILLVDLSDPQGRDSMPVREEITVPGTVADLAASPDGTRALARLEDGTTFTVRLDPLRIEEEGKAEAIAWLGRPRSRPSISRALPAARPPVEEIPILAEIHPESPPPEAPPSETPTPAPDPAPTTVPEPKPTQAEAELPEAEPAPVEEPPILAEIRPESPPPETPPAGIPTPAPDPAPTTVPAIEPAPAAGAEPALDTTTSPRETAQPALVEGDLREPAPAEEVEGPAQPSQEEADIETRRPVDSSLGEVEGRVTGPAATGAVSVVLLGPDNILREARRVVPDHEGSWEARGLRPGRYRVLLDGGGKRVLVTRPPFLLVIVEAGIRVRVEEIRVVHEM